MSNNSYWDIIQEASVNVINWSQEQGIPIFRIEYVASFEEWDDGIGIWIFFETEEEKNRIITLMKREDQIKQYYLGVLEKLNYPFEKYNRIIFYFDSDENVQKNYEGNYYFRLLG